MYCWSHFHVKIPLEEERILPTVVPHHSHSLCFLSPFLPAEIILYIQFYNLIYFPLCFSILLHGFYSHHFNDLHNIPLLGRCWLEFSVLRVKILGELLGTPAVSPTVLPGLITPFLLYDLSETITDLICNCPGMFFIVVSICKLHANVWVAGKILPNTSRKI